MDITKWSIPKLLMHYILCSWRWRSSIELAKTRPGTDSGSDHQFLTAKFKFKLKKVGKTTRPLSSDLSQIPYDYTVEVTNRFKRVDLVDRMPEERQRFIASFRRQWPKPSPTKRNAKRQNGLPEEALQIPEERREVKGKGERERYT